MNIKDILIFISILLIIFTIGLTSGWVWHKNTTKPILIDVPADTVYVTLWKTNTVIRVKLILKLVLVILWKESPYPVYVYSIIDTTYNNTYLYLNFFKNLVVLNLSFNVLVDTNVKTYVDTTYNKSYTSYLYNVRIKDFIVKPAPVKVVIQLKKVIDNFKFYTNLGLSYSQEDNNITPILSVSGVIRLRYKIDIGLDKERYYFGLGARLFNF